MGKPSHGGRWVCRAGVRRQRLLQQVIFTSLCCPFSFVLNFSSFQRENDYELLTLNRSVWDVWKTPINAKYNYWAYNETYAVAGRIKDLHDQDGLLEVDFTPFHMNNRR